MAVSRLQFLRMREQERPELTAEDLAAATTAERDELRACAQMGVALPTNPTTSAEEASDLWARCLDADATTQIAQSAGSAESVSLRSQASRRQRPAHAATGGPGGHTADFCRTGGFSTWITGRSRLALAARRGHRGGAGMVAVVVAEHPGPGDRRRGITLIGHARGSVAAASCATVIGAASPCYETREFPRLSLAFQLLLAKNLRFGTFPRCHVRGGLKHDAGPYSRADWPTWKEADMSDPKQETRVHIRWMIRRDMPEVLDIEAASFEFPWLRRGLHPLPAAAQLHRHGGRARRARRRLHDLRAAQDASCTC